MIKCPDSRVFAISPHSKPASLRARSSSVSLYAGPVNLVQTKVTCGEDSRRGIASSRLGPWTGLWGIFLITGWCRRSRLAVGGQMILGGVRKVARGSPGASQQVALLQGFCLCSCLIPQRQTGTGVRETNKPLLLLTLGHNIYHSKRNQRRPVWAHCGSQTLTWRLGIRTLLENGHSHSKSVLLLWTVIKTKCVWQISITIPGSLSAPNNWIEHSIFLFISWLSNITSSTKFHLWILKSQEQEFF